MHPPLLFQSPLFLLMRRNKTHFHTTTPLSITTHEQERIALDHDRPEAAALE